MTKLCCQTGRAMGASAGSSRPGLRFKGWDRILFHVDEAMSWETARHLERMEPVVVLIPDLAHQGHAPQAVIEAIPEVADLLKEVHQGLQQRDPRRHFQRQSRRAKPYVG